MDFENNNLNTDETNNTDFEIELQGEPTVVEPTQADAQPVNEAPDFSAWSNPVKEEPPVQDNVDPAPAEPEPTTPNEPMYNWQPQPNPNADYNNYRTPSPAPTNPPRKKSHTFLKAFGAAVIFGVVASIILISALFVYSSVTSQRMPITAQSGEVKKVTPTGSVSDTDLSGIVDAAMPSIVSITNKSIVSTRVFMWEYQQEQVGAGSGIIYGKNDTELLIVTNYHVVADSKELSVYFSDVDVSSLVNGEGQIDDSNVKSYTAVVKDYDADLDLAVISIKLADLGEDVLNNIVYATPGESSQMKAGQRVIAIGNALGYGQSVTTGIISATNRSLTMPNDDGTTTSHSYIQIDAAINPGNSGGALLNMNGELIGINSAKISQSGVEGMGYAIPISDVKEIIGEMLVATTKETVAEEERGSLGITGSTVSAEASKQYGIPVGVNVQKVYDDSAAAKAGIKAGYVITAINGKKVSSMEELQQQLTYYKAGETVELTCQVRGEDAYVEKAVSVTLDTREKLEKAAQDAGDAQPSQEQQESNGQQIPFPFGN